MTADKDNQAAKASAQIRKLAQRIRQEYGNLDEAGLKKLLEDETYFPLPVEWRFDSSVIDDGAYALVLAVPEKRPEGFCIVLHDYFKDKAEDLVPLILYQLVIVLMGDLASHDDAESFGAIVMDMNKENYYRKICDLVDSIPAE